MFSRSCRSAVSTVQRCLRFNSTTSVPPLASASSATPPAPHPATLSEPAYASTVVHGRSVRQPHYLPKTHGIPAATLHFRSYHPKLLDFFVHFAGHAAAALGIPASKPVHLPTQRRLWTVIRGPFVHKKSQENFERRTHKRVIKAWDANPEAVDMLVQYLEKHLAAGVGLRTVKWTRAPVGVGQKTLETVTGQLRMDQELRAEKVKALGEQIVKEELAAAAGAAKEGAVSKASPEQ
ncbi:ribosomal protein S10 [Trametes versicolor FP-101664 SS1]|uniref:ribosomal protein S10 n=1 Tax=Trametes versicolor (strain FP-101664) TaxID=717944 RepID=UPI00046227F4|nr:ribosomal protein S10 [Trametes versicolor FP-101664 SS1]EIW52856.1 ribosomal protein S10 [Trametes versicolor FP-101664 SS1]